MTPEKKVKDKVKAMLKDSGAYYFMPATHGYGASGVADIVACLHGKFIAIECKANGNKPTGLQIKNMLDVSKSGGIAITIDESGYEELEMFLMHLDPKHIGGMVITLLK
jgi:hypothetical protein